MLRLSKLTDYAVVVLVRLAGEAFGCPVLVPPEPQFIGAFGAALFAAEMAEKGEPPC